MELIKPEDAPKMKNTGNESSIGVPTHFNRDTLESFLNSALSTGIQEGPYRVKVDVCKSPVFTAPTSMHQMFSVLGLNSDVSACS